MVTLYTLSFLCLLSAGRGDLNNGSLARDVILEMLRIVCPGSDVCRDDSSDYTLREDSCCTGCSCEPSCKDSGNCCFPEANNDIIPETNISMAIGHAENLDIGKQMKTDVWDKERIPSVECLFPFSRQDIAASVKIKSQSFWMISAGKKHDTSRNLKKACGEEKVAPWGSLLPVSSRTTGKIYKNPLCAAEHNVQDGTVWNTYLVCDYFIKETGYNVDGSSFLLGLEDRYFPDYCHVEFSIPQDPPLKQSDICFKDLIDSCPNTGFIVPSDLKMSPEVVIGACSSGLVSPFRKRNMYANVFCYICSGWYFWELIACSPDSWKNVAGRGKYSIVALLDTKFIKELTSPRGNEDLHMEKACLPGSKTNASIDFTIL